MMTKRDRYIYEQAVQDMLLMINSVTLSGNKPTGDFAKMIDYINGMSSHVKRNGMKRIEQSGNLIRSNGLAENAKVDKRKPAEAG